MGERVLGLNLHLIPPHCRLRSNRCLGAHLGESPGHQEYRLLRNRDSTSTSWNYWLFWRPYRHFISICQVLWYPSCQPTPQWWHPRQARETHFGSQSVLVRKVLRRCKRPSISLHPMLIPEWHNLITDTLTWQCMRSEWILHPVVCRALLKV